MRFHIAELLPLSTDVLNDLSPGRFFYAELPYESWDCESVFCGSSVKLVASRSNGSVFCGLFRKEFAALENCTVNVEDNNFAWVDQIKKVQLSEKGRNCWLFSHSQTDGLVGLGTCLKLEPDSQHFRYIANLGPQQLRQEELNSIYKADLVMNVIKHGCWGTFRHFPLKDIEERIVAKHAYLNVRKIGDLTSFDWFEATHNKQNLATVDYLKVVYSTLNFKDIMLASGKLSLDALPSNADKQCLIGLEFSGIQCEKRVAGIVSSRSNATTIPCARIDFSWPIPDHWSLEDAATFPVVYATAYYALIVRAHLLPGESVLIHSGSGGVGQAAISICLSMNCIVYTTVGSAEKRTFLKRRFPKLNEKNFSNSRDLSFEDHFMRATDGRGVDVILNSLSGEKLMASVRCLAENGRFLDIGKFDQISNTPLDATLLTMNQSYHSVQLDYLFNVRTEQDEYVSATKDLVHQLVSEGIKNGTVQPLNRTVYDKDDVEKAFRHMASGHHKGKVLLKIAEEQEELQVSALRVTCFDPKKSIIIIGGLGGFGLELAFWMAQHGARRLHITSRSGVSKAYQQWVLIKLQELGVSVTVERLDVSEQHECEELLRRAAPVGSIFNLAMVLRDALLENQSPESFEDVCRPKIQGTKNLDLLSRDMCKDLDYFVVFSSIVAGRGNAGQTNYGYANSAMERRCEKRREDGFHGLAIEWGAIADVGVLADAALARNLSIGGTKPQRISACLHHLDKILQLPDAVISCYTPSITKKIVEASSSVGLVPKIAHIIGIDNKETWSSGSLKTLGELGMDSLMAVEIKQSIECHTKAKNFTVQELRQLTVKDLHDLANSVATE
ncbi:Fatty acid synthase [Halotydeus destructor]|nr:Fatty acid synthase [Halotydeus destructor]